MYSIDFLRKAFSASKREGLTIALFVVRFDVGVESVVRWLKQSELKVYGYCRRKIDMDDVCLLVEV